MSKIGISRTTVKSVVSAMNRLPAMDGFAYRLSTDDVNDACKLTGYKDRAPLWTAAATFNASVAGALSARTSLWGGLDKVEGLLAVGVPGCEALQFKRSSAAYSARARLSEAVFFVLHRKLASRLYGSAVQASRWHGLVPFIVDGTTISMPDTEANTAGFGKHRNQHGQSIFPVAQLVTLLHKGTHIVHDFLLGHIRSGEPRLAETMWRKLPARSLILGDSNFFGAHRAWELQEQGHFFVMDLRSGIKLELHDLVQLAPNDDDFEYKVPQVILDKHHDMPSSLALRLVTVRVPSRDEPGKVENLRLVTNLLDRGTYPRSAIVDLFRERWQVEQSYFQIKIQLGGEVLRGLTPDTVRKELICRIIAHNLICGQRLAASQRYRRPIARISHVGARDRTLVAQAGFQLRSKARKEQLQGDLLRLIAGDRVPLRPGRKEPRARKRRYKPIPRWRGDRAAWRAVWRFTG